MPKKLMLSLLLCSCASIHNSNFAIPQSPSALDEHASSKGLVVSAQEVTDLSSTYFASFDFTFENKTNEYLKVKNISIDYGPTINPQIQVPTGERLVTWADAAQQNRAINDYNSQLILDSVAAIGLGMIVAGTSSDIQVAGLGAVGASAAGSVANNYAINKRHTKEVPRSTAAVTAQTEVPPSHLASGPFVIPAGLHVKKWLTVYTPNPYNIPFIQSALMTVEYEDGSKDVSKLILRNGRNFSSWQKEHNLGAKRRRGMKRVASQFERSNQVL